MLSYTEENYLKSIYHLAASGEKSVSTSEIAETINTKAASVTDMIKKLSDKGLVSYEKYYGVNITRKGKSEALAVIRKHRLWETFLVNKLGFAWDEVHEVAEQLEHIRSPLLIDKLDELLGFPKTDPHGHAIPDKGGRLEETSKTPLTEASIGRKMIIRSVKNGSASFLQYLSKIGFYIGAKITIADKVDYDGSLNIIIDNKKKVFISRETASNLLVTK